jgi:hypothetical protein
MVEAIQSMNSMEASQFNARRSTKTNRSVELATITS